MQNLKFKIKNLILTLGVFVAFGLIMPSSISAAVAKNTGTGWKSKNTAIVKDRKVFEEKSFKLGLVVNIDKVRENTGGNKADKNTGVDNNIDSGKATANVTTDDNVNPSYVDVDQCACEGDLCDCRDEDKAINSCTGAESTNVAEVKKTRSVSYGEISLGGVVNYSRTSLNTGNNSASQNTSCDGCDGNKVETGDAAANIKHTSVVNDSMVIVKQ